MALSRTHLLSASQLDRKLPALRQAASALVHAAPAIGWIKALRQSLGLTTGALARRLHVAQQTAADLEGRERAGTITLASLRRVADALDAQLVYALVPRKNLRQTISERAHELARQRIAPVADSMQLEAQGLTQKELEEQTDELARELELRPRDLWR